MNGPVKFLTARKILPLLDLLAKFKRVLACSCSPNFSVARKLAKQIFYFCSCSQKNDVTTPKGPFDSLASPLEKQTKKTINNLTGIN